jgi:hypothetical protein
MAQDVSGEAGAEGEAGAAGQLDCSRLVVDIVPLKAFLAALNGGTPPNKRSLTLVRTPPPSTE